MCASQWIVKRPNRWNHLRTVIHYVKTFIAHRNSTKFHFEFFSVLWLSVFLLSVHLISLCLFHTTLFYDCLFILLSVYLLHYCLAIICASSLTVFVPYHLVLWLSVYFAICLSIVLLSCDSATVFYLWLSLYSAVCLSRYCITDTFISVKDIYSITVLLLSTHLVSLCLFHATVIYACPFTFLYAFL